MHDYLQDMVQDSPCNASAVRRASRRISQLYDSALAEAGLRATQFAILNELQQRAAPPSVQELADALVLDRSALGHNLRPLERDGLLAVEVSADDRRRRQVVLKPAGRRAFEAAMVGWQRAQAHFEAVYGREEAARLRAMLIAVARDERLAKLP